MELECEFCKKLFNKRPNQYRKYRHHYCSKKCASLVNGKNNLKKVHEKQKLFREHNSSFCKCGKKIDKKTKECMSCRRESLWNDGRTLADVLVHSASRAKYNTVRTCARNIMDFYNIPKLCKFCDFIDILHVHHIKSISSFPLDTKLSIVNSLNNLIYLCPNHHALVDRGKLRLDP